MEEGEIAWKIPSHIDLKSMLKSSPPNFLQSKKYKIDFFYYLIDHLLDRALRSDLESNLGFINLNSTLLQKVIHNYKEYLDYLLKHGIIECDNTYRKRNRLYNTKPKSLGYRLEFQWKNELEIESIPIIDRVLRKKLKGRQSVLNSEQEKIKTDYHFLTKWFDKLEFDSLAAREWLENNEILKLEMGRGIRGPVKFKPRKIQKKAKVLWSLDKLARRDFFFSVDDKGGRFHSNLTNLKKELRNFITYEGKQLVNVDIKSSQPLISTLLFYERFYKMDSDTISLHSFPDIIESMVPSARSIILDSRNISIHIMLEENSENIDKQDIKYFIELINSGMFYESLSKILFPNDPPNREIAKELILQVFFSGNQFISSKQSTKKGKSAAHKEKFVEAFPNVYKLFRTYKIRNKSLLARLLQRIESTLILKHIVPRIASERPDLPIFTIHDSVVTTEGNEGYVEQVMREEIIRLTGLNPKFGIENWSPEMVKIK